MNFLPINDHFPISVDTELEIVCNRILDRSQGMPVGLIFFFVLMEDGSYLTMSTAVMLDNKQELKAKLREIMESPQFYCFALSDTGLALNMQITANYQMAPPVEVSQPPVYSPYDTGSTQSLAYILEPHSNERHS